MALACALTLSGSAAAQTSEPVSGVVVDVRGVTTSLPTSEGWTPTGLVTTSLVPGRGFGLEGGLHAVFGPGRHKRFGLGVQGMTAEGQATGTGEAAPVATRLTVVAPTVAANFGHRDGWSYISAGWGWGRVRSEAEGGPSDPAGWGSAYHYGGGARWFATRHVAVSFDLRWWTLSSRAAVGDRVAAPSSRHFAFALGASIH